MKETAVEWLINELKKSKHYQQMINEVHQNSTIVSDILEQAKEMEKEQITLSHINGQSEFDTEKFRQYNKDLAEAYYNQTFKSE